MRRRAEGGVRNPAMLLGTRRPGPIARRSFASPFGALRAPRLGDRVNVEFAPPLGASRTTAPARIEGAVTWQRDPMLWAEQEGPPVSPGHLNPGLAPGMSISPR